METIPIELIIWVAAVAAILCIVYGIFKPNKCPVCEETMLDEYEQGKGITSRVCPKCGYREEINEK